MISVTELLVTQANFASSYYDRQESLKKQIDRSGVMYTLLSRKKNHDKEQLLRMKMQKEFWRLTVALLWDYDALVKRQPSTIKPILKYVLHKHIK